MCPEPQKISIDTGGAPLAGTCHVPAGHPARVLVLHGATGVPHGYYRHFAAWCAAQDIAVLTYDYSDFGQSLQGSLAASRATFADWAVRDQAAAERAAAELFPDLPIWVLGHSLGGLGVPFQRHSDRVERIITIGSGMTHYSDHPWSYRPKALAFWFVMGPPATAIAGYLPGRRLGLGADLPAGVYWQWRRWCTRRDFFAADIGASLPDPSYTLGHIKLTMLVAEDDKVVPPVAVDRFATAFAASRPEVRRLRPRDYGLDRIGHIEALSPSRQAIWPDILGIAPVEAMETAGPEMAASLS